METSDYVEHPPYVRVGIYVPCWIQNNREIRTKVIMQRSNEFINNIVPRCDVAVTIICRSTHSYINRAATRR